MPSEVARLFAEAEMYEQKSRYYSELHVKSYAKALRRLADQAADECHKKGYLEAAWMLEQSIEAVPRT